MNLIKNIVLGFLILAIAFKGVSFVLFLIESFMGPTAAFTIVVLTCSYVAGKLWADPIIDRISRSYNKMDAAFQDLQKSFINKV